MYYKSLFELIIQTKVIYKQFKYAHNITKILVCVKSDKKKCIF